MRRVATAAAAAVALLGPALLTGCGGGGDDEYTSAVNGFCTDVRTSLRAFQQEASRVGAAEDPDAATRAFGGAVKTLTGDLRRATEALREADPPEEYAGFNQETVRGFDEAARRLDAVATDAQAGDVDALRDIDRRLGDLDVPDGPPELRERAPACRS